MDWHYSLLFLLFCLLGYLRSNVDTCFQKERMLRDGLTRYYKRYYCCLVKNLITLNGKCIECPLGFKATQENTCVPCDENTYGEWCLKQCRCSNIQMCDHREGCTNIGILKSTDTAKSSQSDSTARPDVKQNVTSKKKESSTLTINVIIYALCAGIFAVILGLGILFRKYCFRKIGTLCCIAGHRNDNDEFRINDFELESHGSISYITDESNTNASVQHLKHNMHNDENVMYDYPFN